MTSAAPTMGSPMNFFERQRQVRKLSARLVFLFALAVVGIIVVVDLAVLLVFGRNLDSVGAAAGLLTVSSLIVLVAIVSASGVRTLALRGGGGVVAQSVGGVLVPSDTRDPNLRRLRNVVEEIAIASGTPVPQVYVLPREQGINAFAAGWSTSDAAVAVTQGALDRLNRAELQGVIAHEFSHVVNGDMRLNIRLMGLLFGILFLAVIGRILTQAGILSGGGRSREDRGGNAAPIAIIGIALLAAGFVGVFVGRIIKAAVSRQREYLADASAVQFTRQTSGLVGALAKIAGMEAGSNLRNPRSEEVGHMLFGAGRSFTSLFATHPPLTDRIRVLDPTFDQAKLAALSRSWATRPPSGLEEDSALGLTPAPAVPAAAPAPPTASVRLQPEQVITGIGAPGETAFERAAELLAQIPEDFQDRARSPRTVAPLVLGLLMAADVPTRTEQHTTLARIAGDELADAAWNAGNALSTLPPLLRLPLVEIAIPALRANPGDILRQIFTLVNADGEVTVHEYCLSRLVYSALTESQQPASAWRTDRASLQASPDAVATLLSVVAFAGQGDPVRAERAFTAGMAQAIPGARIDFAPPAAITALDPVWPVLTALSPDDVQRLVTALVTVIAEDGVTTVAELELLRTICAILHAPLPR